jgi:uncharacterized protein YcbK (DUF882 family)
MSGVTVHDAHVSEIPPGLWKWPHVDQAKEWADKTDGSIAFNTAFLDLFEKLRAMVGVALPINSGYRSPAHNTQMPDHTDDGPHTTGAACDIAVEGDLAYHVVAIALGLGFSGIGINQKGTGRFVHLDLAPAKPDAPRPALWTY